MKIFNRISYLLWPLGVLGLSAGWSYLVYGDLVIKSDWFDTAHYADIAANGYAEKTDAAFFPGFPYLWKLLGIAPWGMAVVNSIIWLSTLVWLDLKCGIRRRALVIASVVPQVLFFAIPYSESLFFLSCAVVATGIHRQDVKLSATGVFLAALIRPTAAVIIPALLLARWFSGDGLKKSLGKALIEGVAGLLAVGLVFYLQSTYTGDYFSFFKAQTSWGNGFGWPRLPFTSWGGDMITLIDGVALFVGIFAGRTLYNTRRGGKSVVSRAERFGLAGLVITAMLILFTRGGELFSLNRFMFATVFFPLALSAWSHSVFDKYELNLIPLAWITFSMALGSYVHIRTFLMYVIAGVLIMAILYALRSYRLRWMILLALVVASASMVVYFYQADRWIG